MTGVGGSDQGRKGLVSLSDPPGGGQRSLLLQCPCWPHALVLDANRRCVAMRGKSGGMSGPEMDFRGTGRVDAWPAGRVCEGELIPRNPGRGMHPRTADPSTPGIPHPTVQPIVDRYLAKNCNCAELVLPFPFTGAPGTVQPHPLWTQRVRCSSREDVQILFHFIGGLEQTWIFFPLYWVLEPRLSECGGTAVP